MTLKRAEIISLIESGGEDLLAEADAVRKKHCGEAVHLRGIIEFSNLCSRNCTYCGLRRNRANLPRYTMLQEEILRVVDEAERQEVRTIVLQSGESDDRRADWLAGVVAAVKARLDIAVTLCVGVCPTEHYRMWRQAGADRYLIKHETANAALYEKLHPDSRLDERLEALEYLRALGYQIGLGNIIGLPGQTVSDLAEDLLLVNERDVDMAAFGPFVPAPATPLVGYPAGSLGVSLRVVAVARCLLGPVHIPATTAFDAIALDGREQALQAGANVIMANFTPLRYRNQYRIYPTNQVANTLSRVKAMLDRLGRPLAADQGHSLKRRKEAVPCAEPQRA